MKLSLLALFLGTALFAQQKQPLSSLQEDCGYTFSFNTASSGAQAAGTFVAGSTGTTPIIDNRQVGCLDWIVTYAPNTAVASVSLAFQVATDVLGVPTTWSNYPGTLNSGINPNTAITAGGAVTDATGPKYPFLRMNMTTLTGAGAVISGRLYGWKRRPTYVSIASGGGCVGTSATPCVVDGPTASGSAATKPPVMVAGKDTIGNVQTLLTSRKAALAVAGFPIVLGDGLPLNAPTLAIVDNSTGSIEPSIMQNFPYILNGNFSSGWDRQFSCTISAPVTLTTIGLTKIISTGLSGSIRICNLSLAFASPVDVKLVEGTQTVTPCDTGATDMTGLFRSVVALDPPWGNQATLRSASPSDDICISMSASVNGGGVVIYADIP
jgi:hypothetical protein